MELDVWALNLGSVFSRLTRWLPLFIRWLILGECSLDRWPPPGPCGPKAASRRLGSPRSRYQRQGWLKPDRARFGLLAWKCDTGPDCGAPTASRGPILLLETEFFGQLEGHEGFVCVISNEATHAAVSAHFALRKNKRWLHVTTVEEPTGEPKLWELDRGKIYDWTKDIVLEIASMHSSSHHWISNHARRRRASFARRVEGPLSRQPSLNNPRHPSRLTFLQRPHRLPQSQLLLRQLRSRHHVLLRLKFLHPPL